MVFVESEQEIYSVCEQFTAGNQDFLLRSNSTMNDIECTCAAKDMPFGRCCKTVKTKDATVRMSNFLIVYHVIAVAGAVLAIDLMINGYCPTP